MTDHLTVTDDGATRIIAFNRPDKKNALTQDMYRAITDAINSAQDNAAIRCLVLTGGTGVFTAGNDLEDFLKGGTASADKPRPSAALGFLHALARNTKPLVAAVDGIGGQASGLEEARCPQPFVDAQLVHGLFAGG